MKRSSVVQNKYTKKMEFFSTIFKIKIIFFKNDIQNIRVTPKKKSKSSYLLKRCLKKMLTNIYKFKTKHGS